MQVKPFLFYNTSNTLVPDDDIYRPYNKLFRALSNAIMSFAMWFVMVRFLASVISIP